MTSLPARLQTLFPLPCLAYRQLLTWSFTFFNSARFIAYLPTIWAILSSGQSSQHSLLTWVTFIGANLTMTCWLFEQAERRLNRAVVLNICNTAMCAITSVVIVAHRL